jgi:hypothetical protein
MPRELEEGFVFCCSLCDSYFILVTGTFIPADWRGKGRRAALEDRNEKIQLKEGVRRWAMVRCPTCVELTSGLKYQDWMELQSANREMTETVLSPCWAVTFEEGQPPPLYVDERVNPSGKPKWTLVSGVGPGGLELDKSRSGRIWKHSLRSVGITTERYDGDEHNAAHYTTCVNQVDDALWGTDDTLALAERLHTLRPLFSARNWLTVADELSELAERAAEEDDEHIEESVVDVG